MKIQKKLSDEKGAISLFTVLSMLFFIAFALGAFTMISRRNQMQEATQASLKEIYTQNGDAIYGSLSGEDKDNIIRIDTKEKLYKIYSGEDIVQDTITLNASTTAQYMFDDNISIDLDDLVGFDGSDTANDRSSYVMNDYLLYNGASNINTNGKTIIYNYSRGAGYETQHFVMVAHALGSNYNYDSEGANSYDPNQFCVLNDVVSLYTQNHEPTFLVYYRKNSQFTEPKLSGTNPNIKIAKNNSDPDRMSAINAMSVIDNNVSEFFIFVEIDYNKMYVNSPLGQYAKPGQYVDFSTYRNKNVTPADGIKANYDSSEPEWRILSSEKNNDGSYSVKIVSTGVPLLLEKGSRTMNDIMIDTNLNFDSTDFKLEDGSLIKGEDLKNQYAESIRAINYEDISHLMVGVPDLAAAKNVPINQSGLFADRKDATGQVVNDYYVNWTDNRAGLINNGGSYLIAQTYKEGNTDYLLNLQRSTMQKTLESEIKASYGIRPVITLVKSVVILNGNGSKSNPYRIGFKDGYNVEDLYTGTYINYPIEYSNIDSAVIDDGWRILDIKENSEGRKVIRIISAGVPVKYERPTNEGLQATINKLVSNFETTTFKTRKYDVTGSNFIDNRYATSAKVLMDSDIAGVYNGSSVLVTNDASVGTISLIDEYKSNGIDLQNTGYSKWNSLQKGLFDVSYPYCFYKENRAYVVQGTGSCALWTTDYGIFLRPVVTLKPEVEIYGGSGTKADPYNIRIRDDGSTSESSTGGTRYLTTNAYVGQYVNYGITYNTADAGNTKTGWRILSMAQDGDVDIVKLISNGTPLDVTGPSTVTLPDGGAFNSNKAKFINTQIASNAEMFTLGDFFTLTGKTKPSLMNIPAGEEALLASNRVLADTFGNLYGYSTTNYDRELVDNGSNIALFGDTIAVSSGNDATAYKIEDIQVFLNHVNDKTVNVNRYSNQHIYGRVVVTLIRHKYEIVSGTGTEMNPFEIK
ncbi:MAG: hypothetical protein IKN74_01640 [Clostridia bacterium]|nr:hypothetical protein [Clostridia bacterium]